MSIVQDLYDSEINFTVATFWNGGFVVKLGDELSGFLAEINVRTWGEAEALLAAEVARRYRGSVFARMHRDGKSRAEARAELSAAAAD